MKRILQGIFLLLILTLPLSAARYSQLAFTSASVSGSGGTITTDRAVSASYLNLVKVKVVPSAGTGTSRFYIYKKDTYLDADLIYDTGLFTGTWIAPRTLTGGLERNEGFLSPYEDLDTSAELHIKILNNDASARTYDVTIDYELPIVSPGAQTLSGPKTFSAAAVTAPVTLTDAVTIATDASLGNYFRVTLADNRTLGNPTNPTDGQKITWEILQDATGSRTLALASKFTFGTDITSITLSTTPGKRDFLGAVYIASADKWCVIGFVKGY